MMVFRRHSLSGSGIEEGGRGGVEATYHPCVTEPLQRPVFLGLRKLSDESL